MEFLMSISVLMILADKEYFNQTYPKAILV